VSWPGNDAALLALVPLTALAALGYTVLLRRARPAVTPARAVVPVRSGALPPEEDIA
jgi:hypothetical protein